MTMTMTMEINMNMNIFENIFPKIGYRIILSLGKSKILKGPNVCIVYNSMKYI
jgi:hypothetical protein